MEIYVVQQGDSIGTIAEKFNINVNKLINDNGLVYPYNLIIGQTLVIAYPKQTHIVQEGDTLQSIAISYNVSIMQILKLNPILADREYLLAGESLVISYNTSGSITTNGFAYPYIRRETLIKILPNLTYLTVFNYITTDKGEIIEYYDDTDIIKTAIEYGTIPLLMLTTLTTLGETNVQVAYNILLNEQYQERNINQFIDIMKKKGYRGINIVFNFLNESNQTLYLNFAQRISTRLQQEGLLFFVTINYNKQGIDDLKEIQQIDYSTLSTYVNGMIFLKLVWGNIYGPPAPVSNINNIKALIDYVASIAPSDKIIIGKPVLAYDWQLPYVPNKTSITSMSVESVLDLAYETGAIIQFDEDSQTPYMYYNQILIGIPVQHIVWFIDARNKCLK